MSNYPHADRSPLADRTPRQRAWTRRIGIACVAVICAATFAAVLSALANTT